MTWRARLAHLGSVVLASLLLSCLGALATAEAAPAGERILDYAIEVDVRADGSLDVAERITVRAEGDAIRRGIYRDFPTRYRDRHGNAVVVDFDVVEVLRDGAPEAWFTEGVANGVRVNTGNDDFLPVPATYTYTLRYRTTRQLGFHDAHDELYWNAIGTGWAFPIEAGTVEVRLPAPVPPGDLRAEAYTGAQGDRGDAAVATVPAPGTARWTLTEPLPPGHGLTIVLAFPKGIVAAPTDTQRAAWFLRDNLGVLIALLALLALLAWCAREWRRVGRDPERGVVIARYEPPAGHTPGGLRYVVRMGHDNCAFSADLLALAVAGHLRIEREDRMLADTWTLERVPGTGGLDAAQRAMLDRLFQEGDRLDLHKDQAATLQAARQLHAEALKRRYEPAMFRRNGGSVGIAVAIVLAGTIGAFVASDGAGLPAILLAFALMLATLVVFAIVVKAPTPEGRRLMDEIEGLKRYLGVAERTELAGLRGPGDAPPLDAARYEALLPYAVALEVEDAWTERFTDAVGVEAAEAATRGIAWYHGAHAGNMGSLADSVGNALNAQIASASTPPGSSSGSGGGGFSGGGGGGGGGGGR